MRPLGRPRTTLAFLGLAVAAGVTTAQDPPAGRTLLRPADGTGRDDFGWALAVDGTTALVGAPRRNEPEDRSGAVYVFERNDGGWRETDRLAAEDSRAGAWFGMSVALSGDWAAVGAGELSGQVPAGEIAVVRAGKAPWSRTAPRLATGSVYVFQRRAGAWTLVKRLVGGGAGFGARFGTAVALDGDHLAVGAPGEGEGAGAAYVFRRDGADWLEEARLLPGEDLQKAEYGRAVALRGDAIAVGSRSAHRVDVFRRHPSGWRREATLDDPAAASGTGFGMALALGAGGLLVGAPLTNDAVVVPPAAYLFRREAQGWHQVARFARQGDQIDFGFARAVAWGAGTAIVLGGRDAQRFRADAGGGRSVELLDLAAADGSRVDAHAVAADDSVVLLGASVWNAATSSEVVAIFAAADVTAEPTQ